MLPLELLQILACPICKGDVVQIKECSSLHCKACDRDYPVVDGIPVLLPEQTDTALLDKCGAL